MRGPALTVRHRSRLVPEWFQAGDETTWEKMRALPGPFALPATEREWREIAAGSAVVATADGIRRVALGLGATSLASYGVGCGFVESHLLDTFRLTCGDITPDAVVRLARFMPGAEVLVHDLARDKPLPADLHLMHRVETELSNEVWRDVFRRFAGETILVVPGEMISVRQAVGLWRAKTGTAAGWARTERALAKLWSGTHAATPVSVGGSRGFVLRPG